MTSNKTLNEVRVAIEDNPDVILIGLSLSICIKEMVKDDSLNVLYIIAGTRIVDDDQFNKVIESYRQTYWQDCKEEASELAVRVWKQNRIIQPRMVGTTLSIADGCWLILNGFEHKEEVSDPLKEIMKKRIREVQLKTEYQEWVENLTQKGIVNKCLVCGKVITTREKVCKEHTNKLF